MKAERFLCAVGKVQMRVLKTKGEVGSDGHLRVDVPVKLPAGSIELVMILSNTSQSNGKKYDFSEVAGRLQWKGDAVREQRILRDEW